MLDIHKKFVPKTFQILSSHQFDMNQSIHIMDKALVYKWTKGDKYNGECWQKEEMSEQNKSTKNPTTSRHN